MGEQSEEIARLRNFLKPYIRPRQEASRIRRVLALHLAHIHQLGAEKDADSRPLALQEIHGHVKSSASRGLRKDYIKTLRTNSKVCQEYASTSSDHIGQSYTSTSKNRLGASSQDLENPLDSYVLLLKQQRKFERLRVVTRYLDLLDQRPAASGEFLDYKSIGKGIESLPPVPSTIFDDKRAIDRGTSAKSITELIHQLEKSVLQAKFQLDAEKRQTSECKSRLVEREKTPSHANAKQRLEALERTRNDMISWMEEQLGKTGDSSPEDANEARVQQSNIPVESQLDYIQKEYRKYLIARQELLDALRSQADGLESTQHNDTVGKLHVSQDTSETAQRTDLTHPYLTELLSVSKEQKSQILQRSHLNTCLAKQQKENMQSMDLLAEESHLLPMYPMKTSQPKRAAERTDSLGGTLAGSERPDFINRARRWIFAADRAGKATRDVVLERVEEGRTAVDESLHTLLGLHQLLGYDIENTGEDPDEEDIWAPDTKSAKTRSDLDGNDERGQQRRDIWRQLDGSVGVIKRDNE